MNTRDHARCAKATSSYGLGQRYTPQRLDDACRKALTVDLIDVRRVERILVEALEQSEVQEHPPPLPAGRFTRPGSVFALTYTLIIHSASAARPQRGAPS